MRIIIQVAEQAGRKASREKRPINKNVIAQENEIDWRTVSKWWDGDLETISAEILNKLCDYFNCDIPDLLVRVPESGEEETDPELKAEAAPSAA